MATIITVRQNGPYRVEGDDVKVVDWNGQEYQIVKRPFTLCRCGASANRPFCDSSHKRLGFEACEAAAPPAPPAPASGPD
jgi:CDGSH-type Zn-finger protein